jgi:hypothetical protein
VYAGWSLAAAWIVRRPIEWIYEGLGDPTKALRTPQSLLQFEDFSLLGGSVAASAVAVSLWMFALQQVTSWYWFAGIITGVFTLPTIIYAIHVRWGPQRVRNNP